MASTLKLVSHPLYTIDRERAVQHEKKIDITATVDGVGRVPIEIKPAGGKSLRELELAITDQLYERYMRPSDVTHGILLVIRNRNQCWEVDGRLQDFDSVVAALVRFAREFGRQKGKTITVVKIDVVGAIGVSAQVASGEGYPQG